MEVDKVLKGLGDGGEAKKIQGKGAVPGVRSQGVTLSGSPGLLPAFLQMINDTPLPDTPGRDEVPTWGLIDFP